MKLTIDFVIETSLVGIYSKEIFSEKLYLKGGQALRIKEKLKNRFSADMDFSNPKTIGDEDVFFENMESALKQQFDSEDYYLFDFKFTRRPKIKKEGTPDFWGGWAIEYKLVENKKRTDNIDKIRREALIPEGASSPKITMDISEYEYCGSVEKIKLKTAEVRIYSRPLLLVEKIRAICQQHPDYPHKVIDQRSRDYYDIEQLWHIVISNERTKEFIEECAVHIPHVFSAKEVSLELLDKIFEKEFVEMQSGGWKSVEATVKGKLQEFDYYNETLISIVGYIKNQMQARYLK